MENKVLEKVKKLLILSNDNGSSEEESQSALLLAQQIMVKNNLTMQDIKASAESTKEVVYNSTLYLKRTPWWYKTLSVIIAKNFRCVCLLRRNKGTGYSNINFIGHSEDTELCKEIYFYAIKQITYLAETFSTNYIKKIAREPKCNIKNSYIHGYLLGMKRKFAWQVQKNSWDLIVTCDKEVLNTLKGGHKGAKIKAKESGSRTALENGYMQGCTFEPTVGEIEG